MTARQPANPQDAVSDELLRWHLCQCVLTHIKGVGEPGWEEGDFGGIDEIGQIAELGDGAARMPELFNRLGPLMVNSEEWLKPSTSC